MLWAKEVNSTIYVDIIKNKKYSSDFVSLNSKKNNTLSELARSQGNQKYSHDDIKGAMVLYNKSICFAKIDSENLSLAYANRSMCFLKMDLYEKCLADIRLAEKRNCPENTLKKLQSRKAKCMQMLSFNAQPIPDESTNFETNNLVPYMSSALKIEQSQQYGRMVTCVRDIDIGETVLVEETYIHLARVFEFNECSNCTRQQMNFIPCNVCSNVMFCNEECVINSIHEYECDIFLEKEHSCDSLWLPFVLRSILVGINTFSTIDEMMINVGKWLRTDLKELSELNTSLESKYKTFFMLSTGESRVNEYTKSAYIIFNAIMKSGKLAVKFPTIVEQRFLIHLIIHHCLIIQINSFGGCTTDEHTMLEESTRTDNSAYKHCIDLITSYFNHSCIPNVVRLEKENFTVIKAIAPIKRDEQIFITYVEAFAMDMYERQYHLKNVYGFKCNCELCTYGILKVNGLQDNALFLYIESNLKKVSYDNFDICLIRDIKKHCIEFLLKFPNFKTSRETAFVTENLCEMLRRDLIGH